MMPNLQPMSRAPSSAVSRQPRPRLVLTQLASGLAAGAILALTCASSHAATITVNTTHGGGITINGNCSLAEATVAANFNIAVDTCAAGTGLDTIAFANSIFSPTAPFAATITLQQSLNLAGSGVTIEPPVGKSLIISGGGTSGIFTVTDGNHNLRRLTLNRGNRLGGGGAVSFNSPTENVFVELDRISAINNVGPCPGGAVGGTVGLGTVNLNVFNSTFTSNICGSQDPSLAGGAIGFDVTTPGFLSVLIENSVFSFNEGFAANGGALALRLLGNNAFVNLNVSHSVFNNNSARSGGAISVLYSNPGSIFVGSITDTRFSDNNRGVNASSGLLGAGAIDAFGAVEPTATDSKLVLRRNSFVGNSTDNGVGAVRITYLSSELINNLFANNVGVNEAGGLRLDYDGPGSQFTAGGADVRANTFFENSGTPKELRIDMPLPGAGISEYRANAVQGLSSNAGNCVINNAPASSHNAGGADCAIGAGSAITGGLMISLVPVTHPTHTHAAIPAAASPVVDLWPDSVCQRLSGSLAIALTNDMLGLRRDVITGLPPDGDGNMVHDCDAGSIEIDVGTPLPDAIFGDGFE